MTDTELNALWQNVLGADDHQSALLVYADAIEELGQHDEADAWRWIAKSKRWPEDDDDDPYTMFWHWDIQWFDDGSGCLPPVVYDRVSSTSYVTDRTVANHEHRLEYSPAYAGRALEDLVSAFLSCPYRLRRELWGLIPS